MLTSARFFFYDSISYTSITLFSFKLLKEEEKNRGWGGYICKKIKGPLKKNWQEEAAVATVKEEKEKKKNRGRELLVIVYL
jgi:hypothetical protein